MTPESTSPVAQANPKEEKLQTGASFLDPIQADLASVEAMLNDEIRSDVRAAYAIAGHTLSAGGKRLRPAAVLLSARSVCGAFPTHTVYSSASAVELIHMASLIHDDVVDNTDERRGRPTANVLYGNSITVLVGDYLLAKSIYLAAREGVLEVIRIFSKVTVGLSEGEVLQITFQGDANTSEETYFDIIRRKTAGFIAGCCEVGAVLADASPAVRKALFEYGMSLGLAFQIADDLLDFLGDPKVTGKPCGSDVREGKMTLPLIAAYRSLPDDDLRRASIAGWISSPETLTTEAIDLIVATIHEYNGFEYARAAAIHQVAEAQAKITHLLPASEYRDALCGLAEYALGRNS
jgi:octaprenyl-diphosphate synthase